MKFLIFSVFTSLFCTNIYAKKISLNEFLTPRWELSRSQRESLEAHEIFADAIVSSNKNKQTFKMKAMALHKMSCSKVLRKLPMFEEYKNWIGFIKSSTYNEKANLFTLRADHLLLPFPMIVHIVVERPKKEGIYKFLFPTGMFTGLSGEFEIKEINKKCILFAHGYWSGIKTSIPDFIIEVFSETLTKIAGEILMRKVI